MENMKKTKRRDTRELVYRGLSFMNDVMKMCDTPFTTTGMTYNIKDWSQRKRTLIELLRQSEAWDEERLCIHFPITYSFKESLESKRTALANLLCTLEQEYPENLDLIAFSRILELNMSSDTSFDCEDFLKERVTFPEHIVNVWGAKANEGMRVSRLFQSMVKKLAPKAFENDDVLEYYQKWSEAISEAEKEYIGVVSVNPLDYLLMSYGNSWGTCQIIDPKLSKNDSYNGEFRAGCIDLMTDPYTVVVYIVPKTSDGEVLKVRKVSRRLGFIEPDIKGLCLTRTYPSGDASGYDVFLERVAKSALAPMWGGETEFWKLWAPKIKPRGALHYADYINFRGLTHAWVYPGEQSENDLSRILSIGGGASCVQCGDVDLMNSGSLYCDECETALDEIEYDGPYCDYCGDTFLDFSSLYHIETAVPGGMYICQECKDERFFGCPEEGCDNQLFVFDSFLPGVMAYKNDKGEAICRSCFKAKYEECDSCGISIRKEDAINKDSVWLCADCSRAADLPDQSREEV